MKTMISLSAARAVPHAIEFAKPKDLKKIPKDVVEARRLWEAGDHEAAKSVLLKHLVATIGEPLHGGDDLCETDPNDLEPEFELRDVRWTEHALPDLSISMRVSVKLRKGVDVKQASDAVLEIARDEYAAQELFGQTVGIEWLFDGKSFSLASEAWVFDMSKA
ncbi:MAG: hypothetical protein RI967_550 [Planctomycetota bacterium]